MFRTISVALKTHTFIVLEGGPPCGGQKELEKSVSICGIINGSCLAGKELPEWNFKSDMFSHRHSVLCMKVFETR